MMRPEYTISGHNLFFDLFFLSFSHLLLFYEIAKLYRLSPLPYCTSR